MQSVLNRTLLQPGSRITASLVIVVGVVCLLLAPLVGSYAFAGLWGVEPLTYIGAVLIIIGLIVVSASYFASSIVSGNGPRETSPVKAEDNIQQWSQVTQQYFELFDHDLGRPLRRILGKERELRTLLRSTEEEIVPGVKELLDEIERQTPNFRLMMSNIRVLVQLEAPDADTHIQPVEPSEVVRRIVDRYMPVTSESQKEITWWSEPTEFGIVYSDTSAIEHVITNLVDNAVRFATTHVEVKLTRNPSHFFIRIWDDGPGIAPQYQQHLFDRGWTPEVARREEKVSSGLGLFIARTLARRYGGDITVESDSESEQEHHTAFLLSLPMGEAK